MMIQITLYSLDNDMVISYLAKVPEDGTLWRTFGPTVPRVDVNNVLGPYLQLQETSNDWLFNQEGEYIIGRFRDPPRDVFADYYTPVLKDLRAKPKRPAYLELGKCGHDLNSIVKFTEKWGPLCYKNKLP